MRFTAGALAWAVAAAAATSTADVRAFQLHDAQFVLDVRLPPVVSLAQAPPLWGGVTGSPTPSDEAAVHVAVGDAASHRFTSVFDATPLLSPAQGPLLVALHDADRGLGEASMHQLLGTRALPSSRADGVRLVLLFRGGDGVAGASPAAQLKTAAIDIRVAVGGASPLQLVHVAEPAPACTGPTAAGWCVADDGAAIRLRLPAIGGTSGRGRPIPRLVLPSAGAESSAAAAPSSAFAQAAAAAAAATRPEVHASGNDASPAHWKHAVLRRRALLHHARSRRQHAAGDDAARSGIASFIEQAAGAAAATAASACRRAHAADAAATREYVVSQPSKQLLASGLFDASGPCASHALTLASCVHARTTVAHCHGEQRAYMRCQRTAVLHHPQPIGVPADEEDDIAPAAGAGEPVPDRDVTASAAAAAAVRPASASLASGGSTLRRAGGSQAAPGVAAKQAALTGSTRFTASKEAGSQGGAASESASFGSSSLDALEAADLSFASSGLSAGAGAEVVTAATLGAHTQATMEAAAAAGMSVSELVSMCSALGDADCPVASAVASALPIGTAGTKKVGGGAGPMGEDTSGAASLVIGAIVHGIIGPLLGELSENFMGKIMKYIPPVIRMALIDGASPTLSLPTVPDIPDPGAVAEEAMAAAAAAKAVAQAQMENAKAAVALARAQADEALAQAKAMKAEAAAAESAASSGGGDDAARFAAAHGIDAAATGSDTRFAAAGGGVAGAASGGSSSLAAQVEAARKEEQTEKLEAIRMRLAVAQKRALDQVAAVRAATDSLKSAVGAVAAAEAQYARQAEEVAAIRQALEEERTMKARHAAEVEKERKEQQKAPGSGAAGATTLAELQAGAAASSSSRAGVQGKKGGRKGSLANILHYELAHSLTQSLTFHITNRFSEALIKDLHDAVLPVLRPRLKGELPQRIAQSVGDAVTTAISLSVPPIVERALPQMLVAADSRILIEALTRSVGHAAGATLLDGLLQPPEVRSCCTKCKQTGLPSACQCCTVTPSDDMAATADFHRRIEWYATYYANATTAKLPSPKPSK